MTVIPAGTAGLRRQVEHRDSDVRGANSEAGPTGKPQGAACNPDRMDAVL